MKIIVEDFRTNEAPLLKWDCGRVGPQPLHLTNDAGAPIRALRVNIEKHGAVLFINWDDGTSTTEFLGEYEN